MILYLVILVGLIFIFKKKEIEKFSINILLQKKSYRPCENDKFSEKLNNKLSPMPSNEGDIPSDKIRQTILPKNETYNKYKGNLIKFVIKPLIVKSQLLDTFIEKDDIYDADEFGFVNNLVTLKIQQRVHTLLLEQPINKICTNLNHCLVKYIDANLVNMAVSPTGTRKFNFNYYFTISTHPFVYVLNIIALYVPNDTNLEITKMDIIGMEPKDQHMPVDANNRVLEKFTDKINKQHISDDGERILEPFTNNNLLTSMELENKILNNKEEIKEMVDKQKTDYNDRITRQYACYKGKGDTEMECLDTKDKEGREKPPGIWDYKCMKDSECPFYMANKNYPNTRGGCIDGMCEMPVNVRQTSPHKYSLDPTYRPYCHKCIGKDYRCCDLQSDKKIFKLDTPDYMFKKDFSERKQYSELLDSMGPVEDNSDFE